FARNEAPAARGIPHGGALLGECPRRGVHRLDDDAPVVRPKTIPRNSIRAVLGEASDPNNESFMLSSFSRRRLRPLTLRDAETCENENSQARVRRHLTSGLSISKLVDSVLKSTAD